MANQATQVAQSDVAGKAQPATMREPEKAPVHSRHQNHETQVLRGEEARRLLRHDGAHLDAFAACPMQSYAWRAACAESFTEEEPMAVVVRRAGKTVALAALAHARTQRKLLTLGHELFEPTAFSYCDAASCAELAGALVRLRRTIFLRDVSADSLLVELLKERCRRKRICIVRPMSAHPWLPLDASWRDPEKQLSARRRSDVRRARRTAETFGLLRATAETPEPDSLDELLTQVFQVEANNWKGQEGSAMLHTPAIHDFYRRYAAYACQQGILRVLTLKLGDQLAAVQVGVNFNNRFWLLKMGYDENFARCSPGLLLMVESLRYAAEAGLEAYEMMGEEEPWNQVWTDRSHPSVSVRVYGAGLPGLWSAATDAAGVAQRKAAAWKKNRKKKK